MSRLDEGNATPILGDWPSLRPTSFRLPVGDHERLAPDAADAIVGREITVKVEETPTPVRPTVKAARVVDDGRAIEIDLEWPEPQS